MSGVNSVGSESDIFRETIEKYHDKPEVNMFLKAIEDYKKSLEKGIIGVPEASKNFEQASTIKKIKTRMALYNPTTGSGPMLAIYLFATGLEAFKKYRGWGHLKSAIESWSETERKATEINETLNKLGAILPNKDYILFKETTARLQDVMFNMEQRLMKWLKNSFKNESAISTAVAFLRAGGYQTPPGYLITNVLQAEKAEKQEPLHLQELRLHL